MTRFLSEALQAPEPFFRRGLRRLETANGHPNTDIRFSTEVMHASKAKLRQLGLDPHDTKPPELYHALQERIKADDQRLVKTLRTKAATHVSAEADVVAGMAHVLRDLPDTKRCFALKFSVLKSLLKSLPPKRAMKRLGYRSVDSFLKHESPLSIIAAAWLTESGQWQARFLDQYKKLQPTDFENRTITIIQPDRKGWRQLADSVVSDKKHNLLGFKELGALILLPLPADAPDGTVTASLSLALHELNEIRASSTFLKLCQVRADFGGLVRMVASDEPRLSAQLLGQPVPWQLIQRYYARAKHYFSEEVFEPHIQLEDMAWHPIENALSAIEPSFEFWRQTAHLGLLSDYQPVSMNVIDAALNYCNRLPFEKRLNHYFQHSLWHELLLRYLRHDSVEQGVLTELQPEFATEKALV